MKSKQTLGIFALAIVAILGISMVSAFGFGDRFMNSDLTEENKAEMEEHREAMRTAIEDEDFESWKSLMEEKIARMQEQITEENFNTIIERHQDRVASGECNGKGMNKEFGKGMRHMNRVSLEESSE